MAEVKQLVQRKIKELVHLHGIYVLNLTGVQVDQHNEYKRLYAMYLANLITMEDIQADINEYLKMCNDDNHH